MKDWLDCVHGSYFTNTNRFHYNGLHNSNRVPTNLTSLSSIQLREEEECEEL